MKTLFPTIHLAFLVLTGIGFESCSDGDAASTDADSFEMSCDQSNMFTELGYPGFGNSWEDFEVVDTDGFYESFSDAYVLYVTNFAEAKERRDNSSNIDYDVDKDQLMALTMLITSPASRLVKLI